MLLSEFEQEHPNAFAKPSYSIVTNRTLFMIPLVNPFLPPKHRKLYPLS